jgi:hypothetical protein
MTSRYIGKGFSSIQKGFSRQYEIVKTGIRRKRHFISSGKGSPVSRETRQGGPAGWLP